MPNPNAVVEQVASIGPSGVPRGFVAGPNAQFFQLQLQSGKTFYVDAADSRASVWEDTLKEFIQNKQEVYIEANANTGVVSLILIPDKQYVTRLDQVPDSDSYKVEFSRSHAIHLLKPRGQTDFAYTSNLAELQEAEKGGTQVLVTETLDTLDILDVRAASPPFVATPAAIPNLVAAGADPNNDPYVCPNSAPITWAQALAIFAHLSGTGCPPAGATAPCIPFSYPTDGCWARAHEMARIMHAAGYIPCKVWCYGSLNPRTQFNPACSVTWWWHVAPCLMVTTDDGTSNHVFDPSMFNVPVPIPIWVGVQNDPLASQTITSWDVFQRNPVTGTVYTDPAPHSFTQLELIRFRTRLRFQTTSFGPAPYAACPIPYPNSP